MFKTLLFQVNALFEAKSVFAFVPRTGMVDLKILALVKNSTIKSRFNRFNQNIISSSKTLQ